MTATIFASSGRTLVGQRAMSRPLERRQIELTTVQEGDPVRVEIGRLVQLGGAAHVNAQRGAEAHAPKVTRQTAPRRARYHSTQASPERPVLRVSDGHGVEQQVVEIAVVQLAPASAPAASGATDDERDGALVQAAVGAQACRAAALRSCTSRERPSTVRRVSEHDEIADPVGRQIKGRGGGGAIEHALDAGQRGQRAPRAVEL